MLTSTLRYLGSFVVFLMLICVHPTAAITLGVPCKLLTKTRNVIVWQRFGAWLMITEDLPTGRTCYYYNPTRRSRLNLKKPLRGDWVPLGSAIKWLMYVDHVQGLDRLMAHDVDRHVYCIAWPSALDQIGCGMSGEMCLFGQYRTRPLGMCTPVDLFAFDVRRGGCVPVITSDTEKCQFAHDGSILVYRSVTPDGVVQIRGIGYSGGGEFEIASRDGFFPSVCGPLVAWAEVNGAGFDIIAKHLVSGEVRAVAFTTANPPCPQAGPGAIFWQDARTRSKTGLDIYGYDWQSGREFVVTKSAGDQFNLRVCGDLVCWVTGPKTSQILWGSKIK